MLAPPRPSALATLALGPSGPIATTATGGAPR